VRPVDEPPGADPHAGWCGEGRLEAGPYPIGRGRPQECERMRTNKSRRWWDGEIAGRDGTVTERMLLARKGNTGRQIWHLAELIVC
jgi:hypothetical protein